MVNRAPPSLEASRSSFQNNEMPNKNGQPQMALSPTKRQPRYTKSTAQDVAELKDYQLGDCLGKGAFGSVYRALNMGTGETVAVKQIRLADLPKSELRVIMLEIDLLKNLDHPNIVKYHGFVKSPETLNIILEYCENGSLHSISKNFGKFPENLVGLYMSQVLHGLLYLHEQGVIHRDIKGANILTTKQGLVKLADFGVASRTTGLHESTVVGTPYWMAPEVIELSGATTASDIWSLGCTVIELLDGKPPYHKLQPMPALFRIVNDDHPPLPEGASPAVRDFLMQCFQKDPNLRVSARRLLKHPWIVNARRTDSSVPKKPTQYEEAVKSVQQWNEALRSPDASSARKSRPKSSSPVPSRKDTTKNLMAPAPKMPLSIVKPQAVTDKYRSPEGETDDNWDDDFVTAISPSALQLPHLRPHDNFGGLLSSEKLKAFASFESITGQDNLEADLGADFNIRNPNPKLRKESDPLRTIRPAPKIAQTKEAKPKTPSRSGQRKPSLPANAAGLGPLKEEPGILQTNLAPASRPTIKYRENSFDDYSDLIEANDSIIESKLHLIKSNTPPLNAGTPPPANKIQLKPALKLGGSLRKQPLSQRQPSMRRTRSSISIQKFAEDEQDEDFSDIFGPGENVLSKPDSDDGSDRSTLMLNSKLSNQSWLGDEDDEDDPFAQLEEGFDEQGLEANIARDKYARLCTQVESLVDSLKISQTEEALADISEQLMDVLVESPGVKNVIVGAHGMLPMLEILDSCRRRDVILPLLRIVNEISFQDVEIQENLCFVGGIPIINKFASRKYPREIRLEAAVFVRQMFTTSTLTLQMLVSAGGLNVLVEFLEEDFEDERDLVLIGVDGVCSVFELQGPTPKNDFCRILSRNSLLDPLSLVLNRVLDDEEDEQAAMYEGRIANIFLLFSQAENYVKELVADRTVLHRVLKDLKRMSPSHQITMLKFIKNLSMLSSTLDTLQNSNAIDILTELLNTSFSKPQFREMSNQILNTIFNLCRLSKSRQEDAALNGVIPLLQKIVKTERPLKEFALPILCDMAHSGKACRRELWRNKGLKFYISLLSDPYWQVTALDAISVWLQEETARVEEQLLDGTFTDAIVDCFTTSKANSFENLLEPLQKLLRLSPPVALSLARPDLFHRILQKLHHPKVTIRLNLLKIVRSICDASEEQGALLRHFGILDTIEDLERNDPSVLVTNMAGELVKSSEDHQVPSSGNRRRTMARRTSSSTTPPGFISNQSVPSTPHSNRSSMQPNYYDSREHRQRNGVGINVSLGYRPASRDGGGSNGTPLSLAGNVLPGKSRLPRTNRLSMQLESPRNGENITPTGNGRMGIAVANARRRRQGSTGGTESRWS
ncbi:MAG: hypothetical protein M1834_009128 [Cirrosporium novae-zelandiae]|nr:MAG: hypothetical protein M1834_009128 [Cirrosporium novae-zelandiae]